MDPHTKGKTYKLHQVPFMYWGPGKAIKAAQHRWVKLERLYAMRYRRARPKAAWMRRLATPVMYLKKSAK
jgi:hypothetical protein